MKEQEKTYEIGENINEQRIKGSKLKAKKKQKNWKTSMSVMI